MRCSIGGDVAPRCLSLATCSLRVSECRRIGGRDRETDLWRGWSARHLFRVFGHRCVPWGKGRVRVLLPVSRGTTGRSEEARCLQMSQTGTACALSIVPKYSRSRDSCRSLGSDGLHPEVAIATAHLNFTSERSRHPSIHLCVTYHQLVFNAYLGVCTGRTGGPSAPRGLGHSMPASTSGSSRLWAAGDGSGVGDVCQLRVPIAESSNALHDRGGHA